MSTIAGLLSISLVIGVLVVSIDSPTVRTVQFFMRTVGVVTRLFVAAAFVRAALYVIATRTGSRS